MWLRLGNSRSLNLIQLWLNEEQFERLRWLLPNKVRGVARVDHRRVISGIIDVVTSGARWVDAPACRGGSVHLNSSARLLSGASAGFMPLR
ncbi:hypothetical protein QN347_18685, partial [Sphingomonas sp. 10B4]